MPLLQRTNLPTPFWSLRLYLDHLPEGLVTLDVQNVVVVARGGKADGGASSSSPTATLGKRGLEHRLRTVAMMKGIHWMEPTVGMVSWLAGCRLA